MDSFSRLAVWIQLPELPIEYYDAQVLYKIGSLIGKPIKIDAHTGSANRGRYARICIEVAGDTPLPKNIRIGQFSQAIHYEMHVSFCTNYGIIGHDPSSCSSNNSSQPDVTPNGSENPPLASQWQTVHRRRPKGKKDPAGSSPPLKSPAHKPTSTEKPTETNSQVSIPTELTTSLDPNHQHIDQASLPSSPTQSDSQIDQIAHSYTQVPLQPPPPLISSNPIISPTSKLSSVNPTKTNFPPPLSSELSTNLNQMAIPISTELTRSFDAWHEKTVSPSSTHLTPIMANPNSTDPPSFPPIINSDKSSSSPPNTLQLSTNLSSTNITHHESPNDRHHQPCSIHTGPEPHSRDGRPSGHRCNRPYEPTSNTPPQCPNPQSSIAEVSSTF
ncbi:hypothetical protein COLO4_38451 [Corchorus olitorius]|uniref:Uncharacterized protein n=1 Tax=Corchorus olitorius TaxID=93759 RepID=A0A1R3FUZ7_9ROSI|nr:hypothetical protein COLO4_38451 [Corchorus olitorius]